MGNEILDTAGQYIGSGVSIGTNVFIWISIILFVGGIGYLIYWIFSFKHIVIIKEKMGDSYHTNQRDLGAIGDDAYLKNEEIKIIPTINSVHKAKIVIKKKQAYLLLFSPNKKLKLPDN